MLKLDGIQFHLPMSLFALVTVRLTKTNEAMVTRLLWFISIRAGVGALKTVYSCWPLY